MPPRRELLPALTPLRFPAALAAVVFHIWGAMHRPDGPVPPLRLWHLWSGVTFFFMLSGFILTHNYLDEFRRPTRRGVWNFFVARFARTYPVHVLAFLIMLVPEYGRLTGGVFGDPYIAVATQAVLGLAFLPMDTAKANAFNSPSWSLSAEWFFYLTLPLLIPALTTGSRWRRGAAVALVLTPWALAVAGLFGYPVLGPVTPYRFPPVRFLDFFAGVLLALAWHRRRAAGPVAPRSVGRATLIEVGTLVLGAAWFWVVIRLTRRPDLLMATGWLGAYIPPFLLLVWVLARGEGLVSRALAARVPTYLGDISFALYMLHMPVIVYWLVYSPSAGLDAWPWWQRFAIVTGVSFALAVGCYHLFEIPLRDRLRRWLSIRKPVPASVPEPAAPDVRPFPLPAAGRAA